MSKLIPFLLGTDQPAVQTPRLPRPILVALVGVVLSFYLSNSFFLPLNMILFQVKWAMLALLIGIAVLMQQRRHVPAPPAAMLIPVAALLAVTAAACVTSVDPGFSFLSWFTVGGSILCGYVLSSVVVATDSRRAYFEALATIGRVLILVTVLMLILGLSLGRGGGFSGWSDNPNTLAALVAPAMIVFIAGCMERRPGWLVKHALFLALALAITWLTNSRAAVIWLGLSLTAFWLYRRGPGFAVFAVVVLLIIGIGLWNPIKEYVIDTLGLTWTLRDTMARNAISPLSGREEVWRIGWDLFWQRPITGFGLGTSQEVLTAEAWRFIKHQGLHFHSSYIAVAVETGIFGLLAFGATLLVTLIRGVADSGRTANLPRESWPLAALPFALVCGSMGHALFESWLLSAGNANMMLFWSWVWMIHHQSQIQVRAVPRSARPQLPAGAALPAR